MAYSAKPPFNARLSPYTSSPTANPVTPGPTASTQPAMSEPNVRNAGVRSPPMRAYIGDPRRHSQSLRLTDVAATRTRTCPAAGDGTGTSSTRNTSGPPYRSFTAARITLGPPVDIGHNVPSDSPTPRTLPRSRLA
jgi:hypothetical protein